MTASSRSRPRACPIGADVSERVVFNGYFLKIMKYQAGDVPRGAAGARRQARLGAARPGRGRPGAPAARTNPPLFWSLVVLGGFFLISLIRWIFQLFQFLGDRSRAASRPRRSREVLSPDELEQWVESRPARSRTNDPPSGDLGRDQWSFSFDRLRLQTRGITLRGTRPGISRPGSTPPSRSAAG